MHKPTLFFTLYGAPATGLYVLAVTTAGAAHTYGRGDDGKTVHVGSAKTHGNFATHDLAKAAAITINQLARDYAEVIERAKDELDRLTSIRDEALERALKNVRADVPARGNTPPGVARRRIGPHK